MIGIVGGVGPFAGLDLLGKILGQTVAQTDQDHLTVVSLSQPSTIPDRTAFTDVTISGSIVRSDGEYIVVNVSVDDAAGRRWFTREYQTQTGMTSYSERRDRRLDPYQKVFNDIANDLQAYSEQLEPKSLRQVRQISELRFFADMSPLAYGQHLATDDEGTISIVRLPAENDPTVARLRQIRERDRLVVDTLNEHYANFYYGIAIPYRNWRKATRQESIAYREVKRSARMQALVGVVVLAGSLAVDTDNSSSSRQRRVNRSLQAMGINEGLNRIIGGIQRGNEADSHVATIGELSESFGAQAAPMVVSVEGQERRLTGTAAAQYESWTMPAAVSSASNRLAAGRITPTWTRHAGCCGRSSKNTDVMSPGQT